MCSGGNKHTSEGRGYAHDGVLILLIFLVINWSIVILGDNFKVFVSCSPQYVHVGVLHGVLLVPTAILYPLPDLQQ